MRRTLLATALAAALAMGAAGQAIAADDGFATFWKTFTAALAKDDHAALANMIVMGPGLDMSPTPTFAKFQAQFLGPKTRACLVKAKPVRDVDGTGQVNYSAFCGELDFGFTRQGGAWKLTDLGPND